MRKLVTILSLFLVYSLSLQAQKVVYGEEVQKRDISGFHALETSSGIAVILTKGDKEELAVSAGNTSYLDEIKTKVEGGVLKISRSDNWKLWNRWKNWKVTVYVSYTHLDELKAHSGGSIKGSDFNQPSLKARFSSGGIITLDGKVNTLTLDGNSGGQLKAYGLSTEQCFAEVNSGAGAQITVSKEISAKANSGGFIRFKGEGLIRDINVNSGGSVKRQD